MENIEILNQFERLTIERRAEILKKYQNEVASKETLSLQSLIDYLAINCVLNDAPWLDTNGILDWYFGVFYKDNSFDIGSWFNSVDDDCYLYNEKCSFIEHNMIEGEVQYGDQFLSPTYPPGTRDDECCWNQGYTFNEFNPENKAFVLPLSKMIVPRMTFKDRGLICIDEPTLLSIYQNTNAFLNSNSSFYQDAIAPMTKTLGKK